VEYDDGTEESVVLGSKQFKWLVRTCRRGEAEGKVSRGCEKRRRGKKAQNLQKPRRKWFEEASRKRKIQFDKPSTVKSLHLEKQRWRYNDIIRDTPKKQTLSLNF
jgi:hypothetical protein